MSQQIRHEFYQQDQQVVVSIFIRNVKPDELTVDFDSRSVKVTIDREEPVLFVLDPLAHEIVPDQSTFRAIAPKIELTLFKKELGLKWLKLQGAPDEAAIAPTVTAVKPNAYPTSAKSKTNWDKVAKEAAAAEESELTDQSDPNATGDKQLNALFAKIYEGATDEQKMAMKKSFTESNGTSLSTNWDEVKAAPMKTLPPDGMIARKWDE
ncbi:uncharacterized protein L969DRAFT_90869 [Mixia osmundae IAM 14324]|uniref:SGS domain-containing protein n=1 Tax=Mixia osmundae (strain CBS 9802 / IAM 14324 / JCM 22182 / KY 12970) TaxID=764103 RepID=G7DW82_MIXOS|nr:uncharacterized protein L969DRAFT_90869 [Mixia osmundae IAM 14324]KEI36529.1 hypothetical protein L969DRAFT_90869 [Mixia osmundae IAM 14324]GAA94770.1 hypothetical protein E5Q_01424 [Mixia osmundae IAM 14324]